MTTNNEKIVFFIGARGGSKGLKNKNLIKIFKKTLISWTILQAKKSKFYSELIVSSDSESILKEAKKNGATFLIKRPRKISSDTAPKFAVWKNAVKEYEEKNKSKIDILVDLDCTNPLRYVHDIDKIIKKKLNDKKCDAVVSIAPARKNPYFNMVEFKKEYLKISKSMDRWPSRRQDTPKVYDQVASIYCLDKKFIESKKKLYDGKIKGYIMKEYQSFDVDSKLDLEIIKYIFFKYKFHKK